jgi:hypothetical protein
VHALVASPRVAGFLQSGGLAAFLWCNEASSKGSLPLRLASSPPGASTCRIAPFAARSATCCYEQFAGPPPFMRLVFPGFAWRTGLHGLACGQNTDDGLRSHGDQAGRGSWDIEDAGSLRERRGNILLTMIYRINRMKARVP